VQGVVDAPTAAGSVLPAVEIVPDGKDEWAPDLAPIADWPNADGRALLSKIQQAGICGMGGAGFPTHVKLAPPTGKPIDTLIVNGAECEPRLTADERLMIERAAQIWDGARIIRKILNAKTVRVAIEDNKPAAIAAMEKAMSAAPENDAAIVVLKTEYPQGAEKQQIYAVTGREVPSGKLPMDVGVIVENVGTALACWDAVANGRPLTERVVTVTGAPVNRPANVLARLGTPLADLLSFCGGLSGPAAKIVSGGPMMGLAQHTMDIGVAKTTSGLLVLPPAEVMQFTSMPCIGCARCVQACPMRLMPSELSQMLEAEDYDAAEACHVMDCIECGSCAYVCPAHRVLVQHMKQGKARITARRRQQQEQKKIA
jgi:electron transport complex protein RnfC